MHALGTLLLVEAVEDITEEVVEEEIMYYILKNVHFFAWKRMHT